jgi:hypothetical protein
MRPWDLTRPYLNKYRLVSRPVECLHGPQVPSGTLELLVALLPTRYNEHRHEPDGKRVKPSDHTHPTLYLLCFALAYTTRNALRGRVPSWCPASYVTPRATRHRSSGSAS